MDAPTPRESELIDELLRLLRIHVAKEVADQAVQLHAEPRDMLEPDRGNIYRPHVFQITSGQFWRCKHGLTGFGEGMNWIGCLECAVDDPTAFEKFVASQK